MSYEGAGAAASGVLSCRYGQSRLAVRGPLRSLGSPYLAFLGGSETYGRFVDRPYPDLLESILSRPCVNLGAANSGLDSYLGDAEIMALAEKAELCVLQLPGAQDLGNRFYRVHPRRNDRFLEPEPDLRRLYPEVDYTEFHFNRHLLGTLEALSPRRFAEIERELRREWQARIRVLADRLGGRVVLLWLRYRTSAAELLAGRVMLDAEMIAGVADCVRDVVAVEVAAAGESGDLEEMRYAPLQHPAAASLIGPSAHSEIAARLYDTLIEI